MEVRVQKFSLLSLIHDGPLVQVKQEEYKVQFTKFRNVVTCSDWISNPEMFSVKNQNVLHIKLSPRFWTHDVFEKDMSTLAGLATGVATVTCSCHAQFLGKASGVIVCNWTNGV